MFIPKWDGSKSLPSRFRELCRRESGKSVRSVGGEGHQEKEACRHNRTSAHEFIDTVAAFTLPAQVKQCVPSDERSRHKLLSLTQNSL